MTIRSPTLTIAGLFAAALIACAGPVRTPTMAYYTLAIPGSPAQTLASSVEMGRFSAEAPYTGPRLAYRTSPVRIEYYTFHRWVESPPAAVAAALREYLGRAPGAVARGEPVVIEGHIRRIEELDEAGQRLGVLQIDFRVLRGGSVWLEQSDVEAQPASAATPEAVVMALSRALGRAVDRLLVRIQGAEAADRATPGGSPRGSSEP